MAGVVAFGGWKLAHQGQRGEGSCLTLEDEDGQLLVFVLAVARDLPQEVRCRSLATWHGRSPEPIRSAAAMFAGRYADMEGEEERG